MFLMGRKEKQRKQMTRKFNYIPRNYSLVYSVFTETILKFEIS